METKQAKLEKKERSLADILIVKLEALESLADILIVKLEALELRVKAVEEWHKKRNETI